MHTHNANGGNIAASPCTDSAECNGFPLQCHLHPTSCGTSETIPLLSLLHQGEHIIKLDLIGAKNWVNRNISIVFDDETKFRSFAIRYKNLPMGILKNWIVRPFKLL